MGFGQEVKDFINGFKAGASVGGDLSEKWGLASEQNEAEDKAGSYGGAASSPQIPAGRASTGTPGRGNLPSFAGGSRAMAMPGDGGEVESKFVNALRDGGLTNPNGLAAFAAYAKRESGYSPANLSRTWSDPSESGAAGQSGGILSWRNERLSNMQRYTAGASDPVVAQAKFALSENPAVTRALQNASSPEEANQILANAWRFAGYDRRGGEFDARLSATQAYLSSPLIRGGQKPAQVQRAAIPAEAPPSPSFSPGSRTMTMPAGTEKRAALPDDQPTLYAASGGAVPTREEIAWKLREMQPQETPVEGAPQETPVSDGPRPATVSAIPDEIPSTPQTPATPMRTAHAVEEPAPATTQAGEVPAQETRTEGPAGLVRASDPEASAPLPPRRPEPEVTGSGNPPAARKAAPAKPQAAKGAIPDNGAPLPGEYMRPGEDAPQYDPRQYVQPQKTAEAAKGALDYIKSFLGIGETAVPSETSRYASRLSQLQRTAASPEEVRAADRAVDPSGSLSDDARAVARLNAGYEFYLKRGEPDKALKYAASMVLYVRSHSMMAGRMAEAALRSGDIKRGASLIQEAHNELPDGSTLQVTEAGPQGVSYAVVDMDGNLTGRGRATVDQMLHMATGMKDGSAWLEQMQNITRLNGSGMTPSQRLRQQQLDAKQARAEADQANAQAFDASAEGTELSDFRNSLTPEQRQRYDAMGQRDKHERFTQWREQRKARLSESKAAEAQAAREKKDADKDRLAGDEQEYNAYANRLQEAQDRLATLKAQDPSSPEMPQAQKDLEEAQKAAMDWASADKGRARFGNMLRQRMAMRGRAGSGGGGGAIPDGSTRGMTADQKQDRALDEEFRGVQTREMRDGPPTREGAARVSLAQADTAFRKRYGSEADLEVQKGVQDALGPRAAQLPKADLFTYRHVAEQLAGANGMLPDEALDVTEQIISGDGQYKVLPDGRVQFGAAPPVFLGRDGLVRVAEAIKRRQGAQGGPAKSTTVANPFGGDETPTEASNRQVRTERDQTRHAAEVKRDAGRIDARKQKLEARLRQLGGDPAGLTPEQIEREIAAIKDANSRDISRRAIPDGAY